MVSFIFAETRFEDDVIDVFGSNFLAPNRSPREFTKYGQQVSLGEMLQCSAFTHLGEPVKSLISRRDKNGILCKVMDCAQLNVTWKLNMC